MIISLLTTLASLGLLLPLCVSAAVCISSTRLTQFINQTSPSEGGVGASLSASSAGGQRPSAAASAPSSSSHPAASSSSMPPTGCSISRRITCRSPPTRKAVVIYYLSNAEDGLRGWENLAYFVQTGLTGKGEATKLFANIDYIFVRTSSSVVEITHCAEKDNIWFMWAPAAPCELCQYGRVIDQIGVANYDYVALLTSAVRGPFVTADSVHWLDAVLSDGYPYPNNEAPTEDMPPILFTNQVSWKTNTARPNSNFLVASKRVLLRVLMPLFRKSCEMNQMSCVTEGEAALGGNLISGGVVLRSLEGNFSIRTEADAESGGNVYQKRMAEVSAGGAPPLEDPCASIFVAFGGNAWYNSGINRQTIRLIRALSVMMQRRRSTAQDSFVELFDAYPQCGWLE